MSQQPNDGPPMHPFPDPRSPTSRPAVPVTVPHSATSSSQFHASVAVQIPPPEGELGFRFSNMSLQASLSGSSSMVQDLRTSVVSSRSAAVVSSNVAPAIGPVNVSEAAVDTWSATLTSSENAYALLDLDSVTRTNTVPPFFPDERLLAWASSGSLPNLTDVHQHITSTPLSAASSGYDSFASTGHRLPARGDSLYGPSAGSSGVVAMSPQMSELLSDSASSTGHRLPPRRDSLYRPSAGSADAVAMSPLMRAPTETSLPALGAASASGTTSTLYNSSVPLPDSTTGPTSTRLPQSGQPVWVPTCDCPEQLATSSMRADFHAQQMMNSPTGASAERMHHRLSRHNWRTSTRSSPYARLAADSIGQRDVHRPVGLLALLAPPARPVQPAELPSASGVSVGPVNPAMLALAENMAHLMRLAREERHLLRMREALGKRMDTLLHLQREARNIGESSAQAHRRLIVPQINDLQRSVARQEEVVRRLQSMPHPTAGFQQREGGQLEIGRVETEEARGHPVERSGQGQGSQSEMNLDEEVEMPD